MSLLIKGGTVVTAADTYVADIYVTDERIDAIGKRIEEAADRVIDARGLYVLPGSIDPHTHMDLPFAGTVTCDNYTTGGISAAFGGTTTHLDFVIQQRGQTFGEALEMWRQKLVSGPPVIDVGFHFAITDVDNGDLEDMAMLVAAGITSIKLFMAYRGTQMVSDETITRVMQRARELGALVMVHAENGDAVEVLIEQALAAGHREPRWHALTRPPEVEAEATGRAIWLSRLTGCPLYVVHVSCDASAAPIRRARRAGWPVWGETCTQYLRIRQEDLDRPDFEGSKYVYSPPPRPAENHEPLWRALNEDTLSAVGTDHAPFRFADQKRAGLEDFTQIPNGAPGIEDRLPVVHHFGVGQGRISLNRMVALLATNPARLFGLFPRKGTIAVGSDADLVLFDRTERRTITASSHHSACDYNLYEGTEVVGWPMTTIIRGEVIVDDGELLAEPGSGRFLERSRFDPLDTALPGLR